MQTPPRDVPGPDDDAEADAIARLPACRRVEVELREYTPTRLAFEVNSPEAGWLLVTDRWSRSWTVKVNGRPAPLMVGDFLFRAVAVGKGPQTVAFEFKPFLHPLPFCLSWGLMLTIAAVSFCRFRHSAGR
jgi:hypothetical protein